MCKSATEWLGPRDINTSETCHRSRITRRETISSPEIAIAALAERTRHIRLGSGVSSLPYHQPLWVANRFVQLDHMTRGRFMLGLGPGSLPTDAVMLGLDPTETRPLLEEGLDVIMQLLTTDEPVTSETKTWTLQDARLHLRPYSNPLFDVTLRFGGAGYLPYNLGWLLGL